MFFDTNESLFKKSLAVAFGLFMGIVPIWGYQLIIGISLTHLFKLNKPLMIFAANISIPPMIPVIIFFSIKVGEIVLGEQHTIDFTSISLETIKTHSLVYIVGSCVLAVITGLVGGGLTYGILKILETKKLINQ